MFEPRFDGWIEMFQGALRFRRHAVLVTVHAEPMDDQNLAVRCTNLAGSEVAKCQLNKNSTFYVFRAAIWDQTQPEGELAFLTQDGNALSGAGDQSIATLVCV